MATTNNSKRAPIEGIALTPARMGREGSASLLDSLSGVVQQAAWYAACASSNGTLLDNDAIRLRLLAANAPLLPNVGDTVIANWLRWCATKGNAAKYGQVHFVRKAGETCVYPHAGKGFACDYRAKSSKATGYVLDGGNVPAFAKSVDATIDAARAYFAACIERLRAQGASDLDMRATPSIAWYVANGFVMPARKAAATTVRERKASNNAPRTRTNAPSASNVLATADAPLDTADDASNAHDDAGE